MQNLKSGGGVETRNNSDPTPLMSGNINTSSCLTTEWKNLLTIWVRIYSCRAKPLAPDNISIALPQPHQKDFFPGCLQISSQSQPQPVYLPTKIPAEIPFLISPHQKKNRVGVGQLLPDGWLSWDGTGQLKPSDLCNHRMLFGVLEWFYIHRTDESQPEEAVLSESFSELDTAKLWLEVWASSDAPALSGGLITGARGTDTADIFRHKHAQSQYQTELTRKEIEFSDAKRQKHGCEAFMIPVNCVWSTGLQLTAHQPDGASRLLRQPHGGQHCFSVWSLLLGSGGF